MFSFTAAYPNIKMTDFGDHLELGILHVSIWHRVQAQSHWEDHLICAKAQCFTLSELLHSNTLLLLQESSCCLVVSF